MSSGGGKSSPNIFLAIFEGFFKWLEGYGINTAYILLTLGIAAIAFAFFALDLSSNRILLFAIGTSPLWLPYILFFLWFDMWMHYIHGSYDYNQGRVSLVIRLPQDIFKSPAAMEIVLTQLYQTASPDNLVQTYWDGKHPPTFALEIISTEGEVSFVINAPRKKFKNFIEASLYGQYPGIEIHELPIDYTARIPLNGEGYTMFGLHFGLKKEDVFPIKTYVDFGLDKDPKEEYKNDPISTVIELLGSLGPGEHLWFQFLISAHRKTSFANGSLTTHKDWTDDIQAKIEDIMGRKEATYAEDSFVALKLTDGERDIVKSLERSKTKFAFDTYVKVLYVAKNGNFNSDRIGHSITSFFAGHDLARNSMSFRWRTDFDYNWWQDPSGKIRQRLKLAELEDYKLRTYTPRTPKDTGSILTTEEVATLYHLPGKAVATPGLVRVPSKKAEAPGNLPL